jgi:hypothetical protein
MYWITGDTHGDFTRIINSDKIKAGDTVIILGDAGINYYGGERDTKLKEQLSKLPFTICCVHGNHENRPENIITYRLDLWEGNFVCTEPEYPNLVFFNDGDIYNINNNLILIIGGAYSIDKYYRLRRGWKWWKDEQPNDTIKEFAEGNLSAVDWKVDYVLTHTCPLDYEPVEAFLQGDIEGGRDKIDKSTEQWLQEIEDKLDYKGWYCGHYHINKDKDKIHFLFNNIIELPF